MITVFFNEDGFCITGEGVEVSRRCSPALTERGDRIFQPQHHAYKVLYLALCELRDTNMLEDVMVYNDSRIVDEINGNVEPLDSTCHEWQQVLRQDIVPQIRGVVFFRKKPTSQVNTTVRQAHEKMNVGLDQEAKQRLIEREARLQEAQKKARNEKLIYKLRKSWFGDNYGN